MTIVSLDSENFRSQFMRSGSSPVARLKNLGGTLNNWNKSRYGRVKNGSEADLTIEDIKGLRQLINTEISRVKLNNSEIVGDQILFLAIGAIKLQLQSNSEKPWELVNSSIASFLKQDRQWDPMLIGVSAALVAMVLTIWTVNYKSTTNEYQNELFIENDSGTPIISEAGTNSVSNLVELYKKMKAGQCQLPQAAMLPALEREAFIAFINDGKVDVATADSLEKSLEYVSCLYPQKLMEKPLQ